ncbi:MAG: FAD-dependent oxidoreductase [Phaeodactylibacter sp.]|nr:FAD-dependent oxidoreductase [Phaeodactylibacter sp.]
MLQLLSSCTRDEGFFQELEGDFNGRVLIIGAGAAGLTAGHILTQQGVDFQILEAGPTHGGRVKKAADFVDFPIDLGAEWIHTDPSILAKLNNDQDSEVEIDIITYNPQTISVWKNNRLRRRNIASNFYSEYKFKNTTWFDFFDDLMVPGFRDKIVYNSPVTEIDYSGGRVVVKTGNEEVYEADKVLVTVPIRILQQGMISFIPELPGEKAAAIAEEEMPAGLKVFIEFSERFYPDLVMVNDLVEAALSAEHTYYDAAFGKGAASHVFALFTVGEKAAEYTSLGSDEAILNKVMGELDAMFENKASQYYKKHIIQNWSAEPYIRGSYSFGMGSPEALAAPVSEKIYFAGEAMVTNGNTSTVHGAAESAFSAIEMMFREG